MTEKAKPGFMVYHDKLAMLDKLPDDKFHAIMHAILVYSADSVMPEFDDTSLMVIFDMWKQMLDNDAASYVDKRKRARAAANARWGSKTDADACEAMQDDAEACEVMQDDACDATYQQSSIIRQQSSIIRHPSSVNNHGNGVTGGTGRKRPQRAAFIPPTVDEVRAYCEENGYRLNADYFVAYYERDGWCTKRGPVKDWKACVRTWVYRDNEKGGSKGGVGTGNPAPKRTVPGVEVF